MVPRKPESVTSSTVSPMDKTKVALTKDTIMYESNSSGIEKKNVNEPFSFRFVVNCRDDAFNVSAIYGFRIIIFQIM